MAGILGNSKKMLREYIDSIMSFMFMTISPAVVQVVVNDWLRIHPIDRYINKHLSITIMRSVGEKRLMLPDIMPWKEFLYEYNKLYNSKSQYIDKIALK